jgi:hypothetical protein
MTSYKKFTREEYYNQLLGQGLSKELAKEVVERVFK